MEGENKAVNLDKEQLEQVTGGWGSTPYTDCDHFHLIQKILDTGNLSAFQRYVKTLSESLCLSSADQYNCGDCPVQGGNKWW